MCSQQRFAGTPEPELGKARTQKHLELAPSLGGKDSKKWSSSPGNEMEEALAKNQSWDITEKNTWVFRRPQKEYWNPKRGATGGKPQSREYSRKLRSTSRILLTLPWCLPGCWNARTELVTAPVYTFNSSASHQRQGASSPGCYFSFALAREKAAGKSRRLK